MINGKILIVDDEAIVTSAFKTLLKVEGYNDVLVLGGNEHDMEAGEGCTVEELYETVRANKEYKDDESGTRDSVILYNFVFKDNKCVELYSFPYES